ncbi:phospholipase A2 group III [Haematobia irritans]|uniref:phospholipase A2 group III n=1 Tax=Haematobia irritans TaxID=7368 RepID=UPI003F4FFF5A
MYRVYMLFLGLICLTTVWAIHVLPEHTKDTIEMKSQQYHDTHNSKALTNELVQQSVNYADTTTASSQKNALHAKNQLHHTSYDKNYDVAVVDHAMNNSNAKENKNIFESLEAQSNDDDGSHLQTRKRRELSDWLIAPNTRWCGRGNTANGTYNHLGGASLADKCCRKHDHCKLFIPGMSNRYGIFNYRPYTLSHCSCDRRFRTCLKMANDDEDAKTIGQLFFNMVQTQCFVLIKEKVCQERAIDGTCAQERVKQKAYLRNNKKF